MRYSIKNFRQGWIAKRSRFNSYIVDGDTGLLSIDWKKTSEPLYQLERI